MGVAYNTWCTEVAGRYFDVHVYILCISTCLVYLGVVFSIHLCFLQRKLHISKHKIHVMLELHPDIYQPHWNRFVFSKQTLDQN